MREPNCVCGVTRLLGCEVMTFTKIGEKPITALRTGLNFLGALPQAKKHSRLVTNCASDFVLAILSSSDSQIFAKSSPRRGQTCAKRTGLVSGFLVFRTKDLRKEPPNFREDLSS